MERLANKLFYTDDEILTMFKEAKDKYNQIEILAQLNLTSIQKIKSALIRAGLHPDQIPNDQTTIV